MPNRPHGERLTNPARASPLLTRMFGPGVAAAEIRDEVDVALLDPAEALFAARFGRKRTSDFVAGRLCARRALEELGITGFSLAINPDRTPRWPSDIVGSISHTAGYCCAVVASRRTFRSIGVDVELIGRVTSDIVPLVFTVSEQAFLSSLNDSDRSRAATIIFSAKEAFYKCQYMITRRWLDFQDASLDLTTTEMMSGSFTVQTAYEALALGSDVHLPLRGNFRIDGDIAISGITANHAPT